MTCSKTCIKVTIAKLFTQFKADFTRSAIHTRLVNRYIAYIEVTATKVCEVQLCLWFYIETISVFQCFAIANTYAVRIRFCIARHSFTDFIASCEVIRYTTNLSFYMYILIFAKVFQTISTYGEGFNLAGTIEYIIFRTTKIGYLTTYSPTTADFSIITALDACIICSCVDTAARVAIFTATDASPNTSWFTLLQYTRTIHIVS